MYLKPLYYPTSLKKWKQWQNIIFKVLFNLKYSAMVCLEYHNVIFAVFNYINVKSNQNSGNVNQYPISAILNPCNNSNIDFGDNSLAQITENKWL